MRTSYLICYDICDDKRLRKVFQTMRNYGDHLQYSVFECQLTATDLAQCRSALAAIIHHDEDQVLFVSLGPAEGRGDRVITALGKPYTVIDFVPSVERFRFDFAARNRPPPRDAVKRVIVLGLQLIRQGPHDSVLRGRVRSVPGLLTPAALWQASAGFGFDGAVPAADRGFRRPKVHQYA